MKKYRLKLVAFILLCAAGVFLLPSCDFDTNRYVYETDYYNIYFDDMDQQWFMEFHPDRLSNHSEESAEVSVSFSSPADFVQQIKAGSISPELLSSMYRSYSSRDVMPIPDLYTLYEPILPDGVTSSAFHWTGADYGFPIGSDSLSGYIHYMSRQKYLELFNQTYINNLVPSDYTFISDSRTNDRYARIIYAVHTGEPAADGTYPHTLYRYTLYNVYGPKQTLFIKETQKVTFSTAGKNIEDPLRYMEQSDVPDTIDMFGSDGIYHFYGQISGFPQRPTTQWLGAFGLAPYQMD